MIVAAHQPAYLPWLGYLAKIEKADVFVVMDDLQYEAQNFQNRNRIKVNNGAAWLTVPLARGSQADHILDKRIADQPPGKEHWQRRTWRTLLLHYGRTAFWERYAPELEAVYTSSRWVRLLDLDLHLTSLLLRWLDIQRPLILASSLGLVGTKTDRIVDLCRRVGAKTYLSGSGASKGYLEVDKLEAAGVQVAWQAYAHPTYPQRYPELGFVSHLSALDLVLNCGPRSRSILLQEGSAAQQGVHA
jgi:hypothetical protein